jgi:hypothetical protein
MATRRTVLRLAGAVPVAALLGACQPDGSAPTATAPRPLDLLLVETSTGLALVDTRDAPDGGRATIGRQCLGTVVGHWAR